MGQLSTPILRPSINQVEALLCCPKANDETNPIKGEAIIKRLVRENPYPNFIVSPPWVKPYKCAEIRRERQTFVRTRRKLLPVRIRALLGFRMREKLTVRVY